MPSAPSQRDMPEGAASVVGSEPGMEARRVDADSSGARDGVARLSERPLRGVELRLSEERVSATRAANRQRAETSSSYA